jgi:hypothetical protein
MRAKLWRRGGGKHKIRFLQPGVFGAGLLEDGDVGVGVLPGGKDILVGDARFGSIVLLDSSA